MNPVAPLAYAIDPSEVTGVGEVAVELVITNQTEKCVSNLCLQVSSDNEEVRVLGIDTLSGIALGPYGSTRFPLRLRARTGSFQLRLRSISLRLDGRPERLAEGQLKLQVVLPPIVSPRALQTSVPSEASPRKFAPMEGFISYSHKDEAHFSNLRTHLKVLERVRLLSVWHDRKILPGSEIGNETDQLMKKAGVILLLVSADFIASDYCYLTEMQLAFQRHRDREASVIPIIVRPAEWRVTPLGKLLALPKDGKAITSWPNQDEAYVNVVEGIRWVIEDRLAAKADARSG